MKITNYYLDTEFLEGKQYRYEWFLRLQLITLGVLLILINIVLGLIGNTPYYLLILSSTTGILICCLSAIKIKNTIDLISIGIVSDDD